MTRVANLTAAIATFDRPRALARCLDALLLGDVWPAEVIVVDQSEDDATRAIVEQRQACPVPVIYIRQPQRGLSASRNAALARARCPVIALTDDDCVPGRGWIAAINDTFTSQSAPDAVTGRVLPLGSEVPGLYAVSSRTSTASAEFSGKVAPWVVGTGANFAVKSEWIDRIGYYDQRLGAGSPGGAGEDMDFLYRLLCAGGRIRYEPNANIYHERQSKARRIASRSCYGRGIGACCAIWLRRGDLYSLGVLWQWLTLRARLLVGAILRRQWKSVYEEWLVLQGTARGLIYGARLGRPNS